MTLVKPPLAAYELMPQSSIDMTTIDSAREIDKSLSASYEGCEYIVRVMIETDIIRAY